MTGFFNRRSKLGLAVDSASGSFKGFTLSTVGSLTSTLATEYSSSHIALAAAGTGPILAMAGACALGGAIAILPIMYLREATRKALRLDGHDYDHNFMLNAATNVSFDALFAVSAACIGAAILGYALVPVATTALTGVLAFEILKTINYSLNLLSNAVSNNGENTEDKRQGPEFAMGFH